MIQLGLLSPLEVLVGGFLFFLFGGLIGLYLVIKVGIVILLFGIFGVLSGLFYSSPKISWVSKGFGEFLVGLNYGVLMTMGAFYVQTQYITIEPILASIPVAFLITAVLFINEFPDYLADKSVGKRNLVVRLGRKKAVFVFIILIFLNYLSLIVGVGLSILPLIAFAGFLSVPFFLKAIGLSRRHFDSSFDLAPANAYTVMGHLLTGILLILGYVWLGFGTQQILYPIILTIVCGFFAVYYYLYIDKQRKIFTGLKESILNK